MQLADVRFGSQADICAATSDVRCIPDSACESRHPETVMSALLPKAHMCASRRLIAAPSFQDSTW